MRDRGGPVCLVAGPGERLSAARVPAWAESLAAEVTRAGRTLHVLACGPRPPGAGDANVTWLEDVELPPVARLPDVNGEGPSDLAERVRHALENLHRRHGFATVAFATRGGLAFRCVQARRAELAFSDVPLVVTLEATSAATRDREERWIEGPADLELDHMERVAFERADRQVVLAAEVAGHARRLGWSVPDEVTSLDAESLAHRPGNEARPARREGPLVSICVPHYNLGSYLPEALASLEAQTYPNLEVLVVDDGSTDGESAAAFEAMRARHPRFRFDRQGNTGIGATRNRGLREARGTYFLPMDADNIARPNLVERLVEALETDPGAAVATCYFAAFATSEGRARGQYLYACRPTGGPHVLACFRNVFGDATALYRTEALRAVGGYETDRDTSYEDWEVFIKLVHAGHRVEVVPEVLFDYRHREAGFSRTTSAFRNQQRVLRQFLTSGDLPAAERALAWSALVGLQFRVADLEARERSLRYRLADRISAACRRVPGLAGSLKRLRGTGRALPPATRARGGE